MSNVTKQDLSLSLSSEESFLAIIALAIQADKIYFLVSRKRSSQIYSTTTQNFSKIFSKATSTKNRTNSRSDRSTRRRSSFSRSG